MPERRGSSEADSGKKEFVITRVFDAPRELIWKAWTQPEQLTEWWGPKGMPISVQKFELRPGGVFHYSMRAPDGSNWWGKIVYREIIVPEKIVFINSFSDANENITRHPLSPTWPLEVFNTLTFAKQDGLPTRQGGKTTITLRGGPINATEEERKTFEAGYGSIQQGFKGTFDQLDEYLINTMKGRAK